VSNDINARGEELTAGQMLGRYELLMPIGKGGMGKVWAARLKGTRGFRKLVAVKTVLRSLEHPEVEQMLFQEAMLASQIHHPNVAETLELGEHEGTLYLVMELVSGESLRFILHEAQAQGGIPFSVSINVIAQVCRGLAAAHDLRDRNGQPVGLVHRDISPPNIMITEAGTVKIVDFGVATTAGGGCDTAGEIKGKVGYFAPEQLRGDPLDARVDVFATGILLYLLTVGRHPFRTSTDASTMARIVSPEPAVTPSALIEDYPDALERIVMRALQKDRQERYQSITELLEALENAFHRAFGPRADEATANYLRRLMKERLLERSTTLRMAEELAERSSHSHSAYSLPATTTSAAPVANTPVGAWLGLGGVVADLGMAAMAAMLYVRAINPRAVPSAAIAVREPLTARLASLGVAALEPGPPPAGAPTSAPSPPAQPAVPSTNDPPRAQIPALRRAREEAAEPRERLMAETAAPEPAMAASVHNAAITTNESEPSPTAALSGFGESDATRPQEAPALAAAFSPPSTTPTGASPSLASVAPTPPPTPSAPSAPKLVSSRLGRNQLLTNPSAAAPSVRLPAGLDRMGQTFSAIVNVCVSATGTVSKVNILRSAGPALDPQIPAALSHWRYRPLLEAGKPIPFCYVLNYEIAAR